MSGQAGPLPGIRDLIKQDKYRVRIHAVQHMIKEGFSEADILETLRTGRLIENYPDDERCLVLGSFAITESSAAPIHVLCD